MRQTRARERESERERGRETETEREGKEREKERKREREGDMLFQGLLKSRTSFGHPQKIELAEFEKLCFSDEGGNSYVSLEVSARLGARA